MSPVNRLAPKGLYGLRHGPEGFLTGLRAAVPNAIVEITRTTITTAATTTMKAVPSSHGAPVSAVIATIMATWTAKLVGMLVHPLSATHSVILSPPGRGLRTGYVHRSHANPLHLRCFFAVFLSTATRESRDTSSLRTDYLSA